MKVTFNGTIKPLKAMENDVLVEDINFTIFGLKEVSKTGESITYVKPISLNNYVEVFNSKGVVSIDLIVNGDRIVIASRDECLNQSELSYLLTRGRVKSVFTTI